MPSRKKRKRYRQRAEATAKPHGGRGRGTPRTAGGWGCGAPTGLADLRLLRQAINNDWPVSEHVRKLIVDEVFELFDSERRVRFTLSIAWTCIRMEAANIRDENAARRRSYDIDRVRSTAGRAR